MRRNKKGSHSAEPLESKHHYFIWLLAFLLVIFIVIYFIITYIKQSENKIEKNPYYNALPLSELHIIENCNNLISKDFSITEDTGISKINGTIENSSEDIFNNLRLVFTLYNNSNNNVYEFEISISNLNANSSTSFSSVCATNLSNITGYSVSLAE